MMSQLPSGEEERPRVLCALQPLLQLGRQAEAQIASKALVAQEQQPAAAAEDEAAAAVRFAVAGTSLEPEMPTW